MPPGSQTATRARIGRRRDNNRTDPTKPVRGVVLSPAGAIIQVNTVGAFARSTKSTDKGCEMENDEEGEEE